jgi:hypothetical protein
MLRPETDRIGGDALKSRLREIVGPAHVITGDEATRRFRTGYRFGSGPVLAVVRPGTLVEQWKVLQACVDSGRIVIMQAANTGLTGGSTPDGDDYDREIVLINTMRIGSARASPARIPVSRRMVRIRRGCASKSCASGRVAEAGGGGARGIESGGGDGGGDRPARVAGVEWAGTAGPGGVATRPSPGKLERD